MEQKPFTQTPLNISTASTGAGMKQQVALRVANVRGRVLLGGNRCSWDCNSSPASRGWVERQGE